MIVDPTSLSLHTDRQSPIGMDCEMLIVDPQGLMIADHLFTQIGGCLFTPAVKC